MKRKRYSEGQIAFALRQHKAETSVPDIVRKMGISEQTFYHWKKKYGGLGIAELRHRVPVLFQKLRYIAAR